MSHTKSCTAAAERLALAALLEGRRGLEADIGEKRLAGITQNKGTCARPQLAVQEGVLGWVGSCSLVPAHCIISACPLGGVLVLLRHAPTQVGQATEDSQLLCTARCTAFARGRSKQVSCPASKQLHAGPHQLRERQR
jgi:hypothetical protein